MSITFPHPSPSPPLHIAPYINVAPLYTTNEQQLDVFHTKIKIKKDTITRSPFIFNPHYSIGRFNTSQTLHGSSHPNLPFQVNNYSQRRVQDFQLWVLDHNPFCLLGSG